MKGLDRIPGEQDLAGVYAVLQDNQTRGVLPELGELALWSQWSRFDPRLAEQLVGFYAARWSEISPIGLNQVLRAQPWPATLGVILEFVGFSERSVLFRDWKACVLSEVLPAEGGALYFIGTRAFAGKLMLADAQYAFKPYRCWGFSGKELLWNKAESKRALWAKRTLLGKAERLDFLRQWVRRRPPFRLDEYVQAIGGGVSRRQAERDLASLEGIQKLGDTRGARYRLGRKKRAGKAGY